MDFTRQPIIETVISPKEGFKLLIRNSKEANQEEYLVNAVEIVSFGSALFFRCLERKPKAFLLPIADYDIVEVKETKLALKNISTDKPIKIAENKNGKENGEAAKEENKKEADSKKSSRKRNSRKRRSSRTQDKEASKEAPQEKAEESSVKEESKRTDKAADKVPVDKSSEAKESNNNASVVSVIFPPPPKIIGRKAPSTEEKKTVFPEAIEEPKAKHDKDEPAHEAVSSKDLPPLEEIKEVSEKKEAIESTQKGSE